MPHGSFSSVAYPLALPRAADLRRLAETFAQLLVPLRCTRPRAHQALRELLADPASHDAVVDHLVALSEFALQFAARAQSWQASLTTWRRAYRRALPPRRARMRAAYDPREATALLAALYRLYDESFGDMQQIVAFGHAAFQPLAA